MRIDRRTTSSTRRRFLRDLAVGTGAVITSATLLSIAGCADERESQASARIPQTGERMRIGLVGVGGRGKSNLEGVLGTSESITAICDVDAKKLEEAGGKIADRFPKARRYKDYRELFAQESDLQAVVISTPDHMHAPVAMAALERGMHVYCEKPLTRTVWESRRLNELASAKGLATQMGNQGSASSDMRHGIELIQAGLLGTIREVHAWTNRPIWPQGIARPDGSDAVPETLFWEGWLGVAPERPYKADVYAPFKWRGWHDFGAGAFGDMGCHTLNLPFRSLHLADPVEIEAVSTSDHMPETFPKSSTVRFSFAARHGLPPATLWWYDGGVKPALERIPEAVRARGALGGSGLVLVGDAGVMFSDDDYNTKLWIALKGEDKLTKVADHAAAQAVAMTLPRATKGHYQEWVDAARGGPAAFSNFAIASKLAETCILGTIAQRIPGKNLPWNAAEMRFADDEATKLVKPVYRPGWAV
jgi:predicted dehydrogenase